MSESPRHVRRPAHDVETRMVSQVPAHAGEVIDDEVISPTSSDRSGSAQRSVKRDAPPRRDLVTFTDEPGQKRLTNRRKRTRLNKGGMLFGPRDREIVLLVAAHGWLDITQLSQLLHARTDTLRKSIQRLVRHGLLKADFTGFDGQLLYTAAMFGLRKVGAKGFSGTVTPRLQTIEHTDAITALHVYLRDATRGNPNRVFITERELQAAATSGVLTPRVLTAYPWTAAYTGFSNWVPSTVTAKGKTVSKRPDGLVLSFADDVIQRPQAVEIERTIKSRTDYYQQALLMFANAANSGHLDGTIVYFAPESTGTRKALRAALGNVYNSSLSKFHWPTNLPKVDFKVFDLDKLYTPFSATRGWIPARNIDSDAPATSD